MKQTLLEFLPSDTTILEEIVDERTGQSALRVAVKWQHAGIVNGNGRRYPVALLQREMEKLVPAMEKGMLFGASYHPKGDAELDDISHIWESFKMESDGQCVGVVKVLPTDRGRNAQVLIKHGGRIGMSSRGFGTVTKKTEEIDGKQVTFEEVNDDYKLKSPGDFVLTPSVPDAGIMRIIESRYSDISDSESKKEEEGTMYKNIDELRAAQPELLKPLEDEKAALVTKCEALERELTELKALNEANKKDIELATEALTDLVGGVREAISNLSDLPAVLPEEDEDEGESETEAKGSIPKQFIKKGEEDNYEEDPDNPGKWRLKKAETPAAEAAAAAPTKDPALEKALNDEKAISKKLTEELDALKAANAKKELDETIVKAIDAALVTEDKAYVALMRPELIAADGKLLVETLEAVPAKVAEAKEKVSKSIAEAKKQEILRTDPTKAVGKVGDPETGSAPLTEQQVRSRYEAAKTAGYKGTLEQYSTAVLKLKK
jgi:hypothetical protein